ncbi:MAG TPA: hypothetical protein DHU55_10825, partial [Blastocatellia bacterium]|nr:hypothetical protein [Blastocatellia bacterium]
WSVTARLFPHSPGTSHFFSPHLQLVYVLRAFQKKSKKGIATPKTDVDSRLGAFRAINSTLIWRDSSYSRHKILLLGAIM